MPEPKFSVGQKVTVNVPPFGYCKGTITHKRIISGDGTANVTPYWLYTVDFGILYKDSYKESELE